MANYPVGLGNSRISILVTDAAEPQPVVMTIYTVHVYRESRPSLPMFGDHVTCSFLQVGCWAWRDVMSWGYHAGGFRHRDGETFTGSLAAQRQWIDERKEQ